jgi:hypothetical protein
MNQDYNIQKNQKYPGKTVSIDLQMNLLNTWMNHHVAEYYQNIFLTYLDEL